MNLPYGLAFPLGSAQRELGPRSIEYNEAHTMKHIRAMQCQLLQGNLAGSIVDGVEALPQCRRLCEIHCEGCTEVQPMSISVIYTAYSEGCCCFELDQGLVGDPHAGGYPILTVCGANAGVVSIGGASPVAVDRVGRGEVAASRAGSEGFGDGGDRGAFVGEKAISISGLKISPAYSAKGSCPLAANTMHEQGPS